MALAEAGETGKKAATSLLNSAKRFSEIAAFSAGPAASLPAEAVRFFEEVVSLGTRLQAQKSLREATKEAQPVINKVAEVIEHLYGLCGSEASDRTGCDIWRKGIDALADKQISLFRLSSELGNCVKIT